MRGEGDMKTLLPALPVVLVGLAILVVPLVYPIKPPESGTVKTQASTMKKESDALEGADGRLDVSPRPTQPERRADAPEGEETELLL